MNNERDSQTGQSAIDPIFKHIITALFQGQGINIQTEVEVGLFSLRIDVVICIETPEALHALRDQTPYGHFLTDNVLEFKGPGDRLTIDGFYRIVTRSFQYFLEHDVSVSDMTGTIICTGTPRKVLSQSEIGFQKIAEGYYFCNALGLKLYLIAINELPIEPMYYSLLLFASSKARSQEIIEEIVRNERVEYIPYAYRLYPKLTEEILEMSDKYTQNLEYIAQNMGQDLLPFISNEDRVRGLTLAQRLQGLDAKQRLQGLSLEDRIRALSDEERRALRQLLADQESDT